MNPKIFKSSIAKSLLGITGIPLILFTIISLTHLFHFTRVEFSYFYFILVIPYLIVIFLYLGFVNNDIIVYHDKLEIVNRVPFFRKHISFNYSDIKSIVLRHEWIEPFREKIPLKKFRYFLTELASTIFPYNYKWIKIESDREYKFYCFGIDYDYYENDKPYFEDLYKELKTKHDDVKWTDDSH